MFEKFNIPQELMPTDPRFGSGPSLVPVEFLESLAKTKAELIGTSHRKPAVKNLVKQMQEGLRQFFDIPSGYEVVIGNGGATFLFDMIALGLVKKKSAHFTCGEFSTKWFKSHDAVPWIEAEHFAAEYGTGSEPKNVADADLIAVTLNETSTGVQLKELPSVDEDTILAVDATSGAGQIECDISKTDIFFFSPQKVFASEGGFFVAIMSPKALKRALEINDTDRYIPPIMNWKTAIDNSLKNQTYNTPSIATIYFLNEQVKLMNDFGGYKACQDYATKKAELIYNWAKEKDYLSCYIQDSAIQSRAVACVDVDDRFPTGDLIKVLEEQKAVYGIDAYRKLGRNQFRISLFHNVSYDNLVKLTKIIDLAFNS